MDFLSEIVTVVKSSIPFQEEIFRQTQDLTEIATLTQQDLLKLIDGLNAAISKTSNGHQQVKFRILNESNMNSIFWKATVRIICQRTLTDSQVIETARSYTLSEFLRAYKNLHMQLTLADEVTAISDATDRVHDEESDCCICFDRRADVMLNCEHSYCQTCLAMWNVNHKTCPICRESISSDDESWVISEIPRADDIKREMSTTLTELADCSDVFDDNVSRPPKMDSDVRVKRDEELNGEATTKKNNVNGIVVTVLNENVPNQATNVSATMAMKKWFRRMQPMQLYFVLALTCAFFFAELVISHVTHALTLLVDAYHMLCNIIALTGCIITIKYGQKSEEKAAKICANAENEEEKAKLPIISHQEKKLRNTFGWARIDVVVLLICFVFLAALCFSLLVEALQTLVHIDHLDEMHNPMHVLLIGCIGLVLNVVCFFMIGGYTFHQGSFLYLTANGDVVIDRCVNTDSVRKGQRRLSRTKHVKGTPARVHRQGIKEMLRDVIGCFFVIICSLLVHFSDKSVSKYIDPIIAIISAICLMILSFPYMKESGMILLQTIPDSIDIVSLRCELLKAFPGILNVHDLHVWQLSGNKVISTAHIVFKSPKIYSVITRDLTEFFETKGITQVTVQPEFNAIVPRSPLLSTTKRTDGECLMECTTDECDVKHCCTADREEPTSIKIIPTKSTVVSAHQRQSSTESHRKKSRLRITSKLFSKSLESVKSEAVDVGTDGDAAIRRKSLEDLTKVA